LRLPKFLSRRQTIVGVEALEDFLDRQAAFMAQKGIYEYSRARSGLLSSKLFAEPAFLSAIETARWRGYALCLQNVTLMAEHAIRPHAGAAAVPMREGLLIAVARICGRYPVPSGLAPTFWGDVVERITRRVRQAGLAAPHAIKDLPLETTGEYFASLPIHADLRTVDYELVTNNLRVNLCRAYEDFVAGADLPRVARALAADAGAAEEELAQGGG
jgi:hypothetical protein